MLREVLKRTPRLRYAIRKLAMPIVLWSANNQAKKYRVWARSRFIDDNQVAQQRQEALSFAYRPLISIITPMYNTDPGFFKDMLQSVQAQTYDNWELVLVDDASPDNTVQKMIQRSAKQEKRVTYKILSDNLQIAGATNEGIKIASGEFISLFDHDDVLQPDALFEVAKALNGNKNLDLIYTDEDKITNNIDERHQPFFKPDWNPDLLRSINYITHFTTIRKSVLDEFGYEDGAYNGTQDWEIFLRLTRNIPGARIHHIPKILYGWRVHEGSTAKAIAIKPYVAEAQRKALEDDLTARGEQGFRVYQDKLYPAQWHIDYAEPGQCKVSIVIHSSKVADQASSQIRAHTAYKDYELSVVGDQATYADIFDTARGDYIVFVNDMLRIGDGDWLGCMLRDAARAEVGFVLAECREKDAIRNLSHLLTEEAVEFIKNSDNRLAAKHFYLTTRYNVRTIHTGVVVVDKQKLQKAVSNPGANFDLEFVSSEMSKVGFRNVYNPYIKVLK